MNNRDCSKCAHRKAEDPCLCLECDPETKSNFQPESLFLHADRVFVTGARRDNADGKGRFDLLPWYGIWEVAKLCEEGAKHYGERNVDKGIPAHCLLDSAARHLARLIAGETDEDHARAAAWNILWYLNQRTTHPELDDMPKVNSNAD